MIQYILECIAFQLVFLIIYDFFLKRETFFQWNRAYLIGTYVLSIVLPWVKVEALKTKVPEQYYVYPEFLWNADSTGATVTSSEGFSFDFSWDEGILYGGMVLAAIYFGYKLFQIYRLRNAGAIQRFPNFTQIVVKNSELAFSFFRSIFLGDKVIQREHQSIIQHELVHIEQRHSWDLLFFELMRIVGWFNPLVYVYQSRVSELHEFIADSKVAKTDKKKQYEFLLSQIFQTENISFVNQFFKTSLIKKRVAMLQRTKSKKIEQLKYLLLLPLVLGMLLYTSSEAQESTSIQQEQTSEDAALIDRFNAKIENEIEQLGSIEKAFRKFYKKLDGLGDDYLMSKDEYFESALVSEKHFAKYMDSLKKAKTPFYRGMPKQPLPSTPRYESYVARTNAFLILDDNLRVSISANRNNEGFGVRSIDITKNKTDGHLIFEVKNVKDLTGFEVRAFNNKLDEIFVQKDAEYSGLILTDGTNTFEVFETKPFNDLRESQNEQLNPETIIVNDIENLTTEEENGLFGRLQVLSNGAEGWQLFVKDRDSQLKFVPSENDSYISGPNGERIRAKLALDSKLSSKEAFEFATLLEKMKQSKQDLSNYSLDNKSTLSNEKSATVARYNQLVAERKRLLKSSSEKNPVIVNLDQQVEGLRKAAFGDGETVEFAIVEEVPVFPGCESEDDKRACFQKNIQRHISKNFRYPQEAQEKEIQGKVAIMFTISENGSIENVKMRGPHQLLEEEAERIISRLPEMKPGKHNGELVNVAYSIPITFKLEGNGVIFRTSLNLDTVKEIDPPPFPTSLNFVKIPPLYIIDGVESTKEVLGFINPNDIASINVLKGEYAFNIYGEKGENGVIVILTKKDSIAVTAAKNGADPLIILDGEESTREVTDNIDPKDIATMYMLKDEAAFNKYGEKGKNGVIEILTKKNGNAAKESNEIYKADTSTMSVTATAKNKRSTKIISGTVTDGMMGLPGATIGIQGSERGVISDFDGKFEIKAKKGDIITFQYIGLPILKLTISDEEDYHITKKR